MNTNENEDILIKQYIKDISAYKRLTPQEQKKLFKTLHTSKNKKLKEKAKNEIILGNLRLVIKCAYDILNKFKKNPDSLISIMDMIQAGNIGLMKSIDYYNPTKKAQFSTYAYLIIMRYIMKFMTETRFVKVPAYYFHHFSDMEKIINKSDNVSEIDLFKKMKISKNLFEIVKKNYRNKTNLEGLKTNKLETSYNIDICDLIIDENANVVKDIQDADIYNYIYRKLDLLTPIQKEILIDYFFSGSEQTLGRMSQKHNCSRENIRQHLIKAMKSLKYKIAEDQTEEQTI